MKISRETKWMIIASLLFSRLARCNNTRQLMAVTYDVTYKDFEISFSFWEPLKQRGDRRRCKRFDDFLLRRFLTCAMAVYENVRRSKTVPTTGLFCRATEKNFANISGEISSRRATNIQKFVTQETNHDGSVVTSRWDSYFITLRRDTQLFLCITDILLTT